MASAKNKVDVFVNEKIQNELLENIIGERFGRYSKYIIQDRALPDVRDGLKPVQRRILFAMNQLGMGSDKPYKKSARIVGEVIGKYHPHGDTSVYDAMVRMSQTWKMGSILIDMHGNNGSQDGDGPAAMRYTEARLSPTAEALLADLDKKTVAFVPNFDDEEYEPVVLPAKFPNLLVNGSMGMATGYATNIPPHNLNEIIEAVIHRIDNPDCSIEDLMAFVKGPDFPTGGIVEGLEEIKRAFRTGRGRIVMKSKVEMSETQLVITEIPYEVNKSDLVRKIDEIRTNRKIDGIVEVRDESDREGLRIVVEKKKEMESGVILAYLHKNTDLSLSFNYNMVAIDNRSPHLMGLTEILDSYIQHQKEVVRNRSNFDLMKAEKRRHIVEGFLKMVDILDEVIATIRAASGKKSAMEALVSKFAFTEAQAEAIVTLQLYRLSATDVEEMRAEATDLSRQINWLNRILKNESELQGVIKKELAQFSEKNPTPRRTTISETIEKVAISEQDLYEHENVVVALTRDGYLKRSSLKSVMATNGDVGLKPNDCILKQIEVNTRQTILVFTNLGNYIYLPVYKIPDKKWKEIGEYIGSIAPIGSEESVLDFLLINQFDDRRILLATQEGLIKLVQLKEFLPSRTLRSYGAIPASVDNPLVAVDLVAEYDTAVICASRNGYVLKYRLEEVPVLSLGARGVKAINLRDDALVGACAVTDITKDEVLFLINRGTLKREFVANIETSHRPAKGKMFLKSVKTNPYQFVGMVSANVFRLKEHLLLRIITDKNVVTFTGIDLPVDKFEHGVPLLDKEFVPLRLLFDEQDKEAIDDIQKKLAKERRKDLPEASETENVPPPEPTEVETDDVMDALEKIININASEDDPDGEKVIQQTLF
ncbi:MAG TPA: DNA topoisomerase IV subunit A [Candidatus Izemoplasmatales bacterium]|nr:DNA topoisomerase IV subunit A [Candidatus Izemoplasmatales bacterium]